MGDVKVITLNQTYVFFKRVQDESLELPEALVYSRSAALFHDRFGRLQKKSKKVRHKYSAQRSHASNPTLTHITQLQETCKLR